MQGELSSSAREQIFSVEQGYDFSNRHGSHTPLAVEDDHGRIVGCRQPVLDAVRTLQQPTAHEITERTGLSDSTTRAHPKRMIDEGYIAEIRERPRRYASRGRVGDHGTPV